MSIVSSLQLLHVYDSESSEDEVPGPRVSTKRSLNEDRGPENSKKLCTRLPVPEQFVAEKPVEHIDDPCLHDGRIRTIPHERGCWAVFVYIPFTETSGVRELCSFIKELVPDRLNLHVSNEFHISLSKILVIKFHWISSFVQTLKDRINPFKKFFILFDGLKVYCNEEKTRTFISLEIRCGHNTLVQLVDAVDRCLDDFELPTFYKNPSFHMSIAWCADDKQEELEPYLAQFSDKLEELKEAFDQDNWYLFAELIMCKVGNKIFQFTLQ
ncbi:U6 snRNA phosphodiesterase 1 isoform X2 [Dendroctonus ponderosae]|uniref:U6 snRNA phosphodiesterase n=1 Tax=Dendroctonus ponderosae TaxID=77166 RepID=A0AAR5PLI9_DENPD|nr:U6 snRNA phosphodiesterase 1 isoform X2 [Dendroctonus ponderosae]KAH1002844.1 hypothetical protein HUJ04_008881 [Dendroctonus ponderosae]KAH1008852.1 hypothetical protein HUJ05_009355 [Dendroctonus ponderosae]